MKKKNVKLVIEVAKKASKITSKNVHTYINRIPVRPEDLQ